MVFGDTRNVECWTGEQIQPHELSQSRQLLAEEGKWGVGGAGVQLPHMGLTSVFTFWQWLCGRGRMEQTQPWKQKKANTVKNLGFSPSFHFPHTFGLMVSFYIYYWNKVWGAYVTSLNEFLSSLPRFCMYSHCPSDRLCPPMKMFSTLSCSSSNSHCTTNRGAREERR